VSFWNFHNISSYLIFNLEKRGEEFSFSTVSTNLNKR